MFCSLPCQCNIPFRNLVISKQIIQSTAKTTFHSSRRAHTSTERNITSKGYIKSFYINTKCFKLLNHTIDESCPCSAWTFWIVYLKFNSVFQVYRVTHYSICSVRSYFCHDTLIYGTREYETSIIICMFTNEINTSW